MLDKLEEQESHTRIHALIEGQVQGVGYRAFAQYQGRQRHLRGWVRNLSSGQVELEAEGSPTHIDAFLEALREGPTFAKVTNIEVESIEVTNESQDFTIIR